METTEATPKKQKKPKKNRTVASPKPAAPTEIKLDREDILSLELISEKTRRLEAEQQRIRAEQKSLQQENILYVQGLNTKYGIDMNGYSIDLDAGVAKPKAQ